MVFFFIKSFFMFAVSVMVSDFWQFVLPLSVFKEPTFRLKIIFSITFCFYFYFFPSIFCKNLLQFFKFLKVDTQIISDQSSFFNVCI